MAEVRVGAVIAVIAAAVSMGCAGIASADQPGVDSPCAGSDLGRAATAIDGSGVTCIADDAGRLTWMPNGSAVKTIADLQAQGYTVTIDQIGDDPLPTCIVTEVHNAATTTERLGSGGTTPGGTGSAGNHHSTTITVTKTIDVSLDCTGHG